MLIDYFTKKFNDELFKVEIFSNSTFPYIFDSLKVHSKSKDKRTFTDIKIQRVQLLQFWKQFIISVEVNQPTAFPQNSPMLLLG